MARYYFHLIAASKWQVSDDEHFPNDAAAIAHGRKVARDMVANQRSSMRGRSATLRVTDRDGGEILALRLSEA